VRHGFDVPADVAHLAKDSFFVLRPPSLKPASSESMGALIKPHWDAERRDLRYGDKVVKRYRQRAANQCRLLSAFEELGWPPRIDDPLPPKGDTDRCERLRDTVRALNNNCLGLHFVLDGTGEGVIWSVAPDGDAGAGPGNDISS
jgi:hypothetical protein